MARKKKPAGEGNGKSKAGEAETGAAQAGESEAGAAEAADQSRAQFSVLAQFVKDLSFESPHAPMSLQSPGENPRLQVNVQVQALRHSDELFEVDLMFEAKAESDIGVIYNIELAYGGMFQATNIPDQYLKSVLFVDAPTIIFPFMRRVIADTTRDGGFQPLLLDPIDFAQLFQQNGEKAQVQDLRPS